MQARFGQTLFTGLAAGFIVASGVATATAVAAGQQETTRFFSSSAQSTAAAQAACIRTVSVENVEITGTATASGVARGTYSKTGLAQALATVSGHSRVDFNGYGGVVLEAIVKGAPYRLVRAYPYSGVGTATLQGEAFSYQYGAAVPALCTASALGTTYFVGHGEGITSATALGTCIKQAGAIGTGVATCEGENTDLLREAGAQTDAYGTALGMGYPSVTINGVRGFDGSGSALATCEASTPNSMIYQPQTMYAVAEVSGTCMASFGGKGRGKAFAIGKADGIGSKTSVTGGGAAQALASGRAKYTLGAVSNPQATAKAAMVKDAVVKQTRVSGTALAYATAKGTRFLIREVYGSAVAQASQANFPTKTQTVQGTALAYGTATKKGVQISVVVSAIATADVEQQLYAIRLQAASGTATAQANAEGYNQVNDLIRAPADRTLYPLIEDRLLSQAAEDRSITV